MDSIPYEDCSRNPQWKATEGLENPWDENDPSPLLKIPSRQFSPHQFFRKDPFHIYKQTIGGHFVASALILLCDLGYFIRAGKPTDASTLLQIAYDDFDYFMKCEWTGGHVANLKSFTKAVFHWNKLQSFPYVRPKGADVMLLQRWLCQLIHKGLFDERVNKRQERDLIANPLDPSHSPLLRLVLKAAIAGLNFFHVLHRKGIWHSRNDASAVANSSFDFCDAYAQLAKQCHTMKLMRFHLTPSLHYFHHFAIDTWERLSQGDSNILSPNVDNCEMDEDFVGKIIPPDWKLEWGPWGSDFFPPS